MCIHCVTLGVALGIAGILVRWSTTLAVGYRVSAESHEHAARQGQCQRQPQTRVMVLRPPSCAFNLWGYGTTYSGGGKARVTSTGSREAPIKHATKTVKHRGARGPSAQSELLQVIGRTEKARFGEQSSCTYVRIDPSRFGNAGTTSFKTTFPKLALRWRRVCT